ncbi:hypothetical protein [Xanthomonas bromi]|nr:hypothetical protein [Xanthomonas bromi]
MRLPTMLLCTSFACEAMTAVERLPRSPALVALQQYKVPPPALG